MSKCVTFWNCEPAAGRRTIARALARAWADQGMTTLLLGISPDASPDAAPSVALLESLSPLLLRNYLSQGSDAYATLALPQWPELKMIPKLAGLLKRSFDRIIVCGAQTFTSEETAWLDATDLLLCVARPGASSAAGFKTLLDTLAAAHLPHAFCRVLFNRVPEKQIDVQETAEIVPGYGAFHCIAEDPGTGLRIKEGVRRLSARLDEQTLPGDSSPAKKDRKDTQGVVDDIKSRVQPKLLDQALSAETAQKTVESYLAQDGSISASREKREEILTRVLDEVLGLGPIEPLLKDATVSEVMVNGRGCVYVERKGRLQPTDVTFSSDAQLRTVIDRIVAPIGRRVDESMPLCDARLTDGSRVNIVLPPLALDGPTVTIRKFTARALGFEDLVRLDSLSPAMANFLRECVIGKRNIVVSGGTGSGKTTLLNALSSVIPDDERIVTIEDAAELRLQKPHVVRLESRPPNAEGEGAISIRRLVMNALRMRPDRIVVGECRGGEALDMLQAMNTGHDGSLTTVHANSPRDALGRLETLVLMSGMDLPVKVVREQIRSAVHLIVQQSRLRDGSRKVVSITEVTGMEGETLSTQEIFRHGPTGFEATGIRTVLKLL